VTADIETVIDKMPLGIFINGEHNTEIGPKLNMFFSYMLHITHSEIRADV